MDDASPPFLLERLDYVPAGESAALLHVRGHWSGAEPQGSAALIVAWERRRERVAALPGGSGSATPWRASFTVPRDLVEAPGATLTLSVAELEIALPAPRLDPPGEAAGRSYDDEFEIAVLRERVDQAVARSRDLEQELRQVFAWRETSTSLAAAAAAAEKGRADAAAALRNAQEEAERRLTAAHADGVRAVEAIREQAARDAEARTREHEAAVARLTRDLEDAREAREAAIAAVEARAASEAAAAAEREVAERERAAIEERARGLAATAEQSAADLAAAQAENAQLIARVEHLEAQAARHEAALAGATRKHDAALAEAQKRTDDHAAAGAALEQRLAELDTEVAGRRRLVAEWETRRAERAQLASSSRTAVLALESRIEGVAAAIAAAPQKPAAPFATLDEDDPFAAPAAFVAARGADELDQTIARLEQIRSQLG